MLLLTAFALAAGPRLLLVGDTGEDTPIGRVVSADIGRELPSADWLLALGDFLYDAPPIDDADCAGKLAEKIRLYYGTFDPKKVIPVLGNHDVTTVEQKSFSPAARACSVAAFEKLGWTKGDYPSHVDKLDKGGVALDLAVLDAGFYGSGAPVPSLKFRDTAWRAYAAHYSWRTTSGKCSEQDKIPVEWLGKPPMDFWLNGHAHHLDAVPVDTVLALTSGGGMELRTPTPCEGVTGLFTYVQLPDAPVAGGYVALDVISATQVRFTPRVCTLDGCDWKPAVTCTRDAKVHGVACVLDAS
ncbi:hypothetical protein LBMAG42_52690 [Deltaproteobacteria bacterium]|nr:hypothetical protein LBMAG42_52690 [Deltaproteobacteria bacterium]